MAKIDHTFRSMFLTVRPRVASLEIKARLFGAGIIRAPLGLHINHAVLSVKRAVHARLASLKIEFRMLGARGI